MIKEYRIKNNISIAKICRYLYIDYKTYLRYEENNMIMPIDVLLLYSKAFKLPINYLLNYIGDKTYILIKPIKNIRKSKHLSQQDVENKTGIKRRNISNIEAQTQTIKISELLLLSNLYNIDPETLIRCIYY